MTTISRSLNIFQFVRPGCRRHEHAALPPLFLSCSPILRGHPRFSFGKGAGLPGFAGDLSPEDSSCGAPGEGFEVIAQSGDDEMSLVAGSRPGSCAARTFSKSETICPSPNERSVRTGLDSRASAPTSFSLSNFLSGGKSPTCSFLLGISLPSVEEAQPAFSLQLEGSLQHLRARLRCRYGERPAFSPMSEPGKPVCSPRCNQREPPARAQPCAGAGSGDALGARRFCALGRRL